MRWIVEEYLQHKKLNNVEWLWDGDFVVLDVPGHDEVLVHIDEIVSYVQEKSHM